MSPILFLLRYRQGNVGATSSYVQVTNPSPDPKINRRLAEEIGQAYCAREPNRRYIRVEDAVVADESYLDPAFLDSILNPKPPEKVKLTPKEEKELERDEDPMTGRPMPPKVVDAVDPVLEEDEAEEPPPPPPPPVKKSKKR